MENQSNLQGSTIHKRLNSTTMKQGKQNLLKKRPSTTKLDLEKIFQESIELTQVFKKLSAENSQLKQEYQKVQSTKSSRQSLISLVQQIVKEKARQLNKNPTNQSSWLVHKLNAKVYELKNKIEAKQKAIREVQMSKQSEWIRQKQCQLKCLDQVLNHMKSLSSKNSKKNDYCNQQDKQQENSDKKDARLSMISGIKEIVWLQQEIRNKEDEILQAERQFEDQQRQSRKVMLEISKKKAELKQIKELQEQFYRAQQEFKEEKKKKQQRLAGNKTYLDQLIQSRHHELKKLEQLKEKYNIIEGQENKNILQLEVKLQKMKKQYEQKNKARQELIFRVVQEPVASSKQKWVKRVTFNEVKNIAKNLNYFIALKRVPKQWIFKNIFKEDQDDELSIRQVISILEQYPFQINDYHDRELLARYCIEDAGDGYFLEDMETSEAVPIIKSVLSKLIGEVRIYSQEQQTHLMQKTGELMLKFHSLVQQNIETKEGSVKKVTKQSLEEGIISTQLDLNHDEINFIVLYIFSWTHNIDQLQMSLLGQMLEKKVKWFKRQYPGQNQPKILNKLNQLQSEQYVEQFN